MCSALTKQPVQVWPEDRWTDNRSHHAERSHHVHEVSHDGAAVCSCLEQVLVPHRSERAADLLVDEAVRPLVLAHAASQAPDEPQMTSPERHLVATTELPRPAARRSRLPAAGERRRVRVDV